MGSTYSTGFEGTLDGWTTFDTLTDSSSVPIAGSFSALCTAASDGSSPSMSKQLGDGFSTFLTFTAGLAVTFSAASAGLTATTATVTINIENSSNTILAGSTSSAQALGGTLTHTFASPGGLTAPHHWRVIVQCNAVSTGQGFKLDTVSALEIWTKALSGGLTPSGVPGQVFVPGPINVPFLRRWDQSQRANALRM